jgi:hypothetical protein
MKYDDDTLISYPADKIRNLFANCQRSDSDDARVILDQIERLGLLTKSMEGMRMSDPTFIRMEEIINSEEGTAAIKAAIARGEPGLAGIEPVIVAELGDRYGARDMGTVNAGWLVGQLMMSAGYNKGPARKMPPGSVAKSAATWVPKTRT